MGMLRRRVVDVQVNSEQALGTVQEMQEAIEQRSSATSATAQQLLATMPGVQGLAALEVLEETLREAVELLEDGEGSVEAFRLLEALDVMIEEADFWPETPEANRSAFLTLMYTAWLAAVNALRLAGQLETKSMPNWKYVLRRATETVEGLDGAAPPSVSAAAALLQRVIDAADLPQRNQDEDEEGGEGQEGVDESLDSELQQASLAGGLGAAVAQYLAAVGKRQLGGQEYDLSIPAVVQALHTRLAGGGLAGQGGGPELSDEEGLGVGGGGGGDQGGVLTSDIGEDSEAMMMTGGGDVMAMQEAMLLKGHLTTRLPPAAGDDSGGRGRLAALDNPALRAVLLKIVGRLPQDHEVRQEVEAEVGAPVGTPAYNAALARAEQQQQQQAGKAGPGGGGGGMMSMMMGRVGSRGSSLLALGSTMGGGTGGAGGVDGPDSADSPRLGGTGSGIPGEGLSVDVAPHELLGTGALTSLGNLTSPFDGTALLSPLASAGGTGPGVHHTQQQMVSNSGAPSSASTFLMYNSSTGTAQGGSGNGGGTATREVSLAVASSLSLDPLVGLPLPAGQGGASAMALALGGQGSLMPGGNTGGGCSLDPFGSLQPGADLFPPSSSALPQHLQGHGPNNGSVSAGLAAFGGNLQGQGMAGGAGGDGSGYDSEAGGAGGLGGDLLGGPNDYLLSGDDDDDGGLGGGFGGGLGGDTAAGIKRKPSQSTLPRNPSKLSRVT